MTHQEPPAFRPLTGVYEPSAIRQLPDGRLLVIEDEKDHPFSLVTIDAGRVDSVALTATLLQTFSDFWKLDDLEGLALDRSGFVYAITSHSRDDEGRAKKSRERLVRFRVDGNRVVDPKVVEGLKKAMTTQHPLLASAAKVRQVKAAGGLNIEALEIDPFEHHLLIGFRSPLREGRAIIASLVNPTALFEADEEPQLSPDLDELDLDGHGIRALSFLPALGQYLVVGGPVSSGPAEFSLWLWNGRRSNSVRRVAVPGLPDLARTEGVSPATIDGAPGILMVSDDGDRKAGRSASYLWLGLDQLQMAS
ncbi:DUF3616 domain-containing protein [Variovorax sp. J22P240]|uniref:DUF3616 domain-containing protein n=1 Tax=Variovorax sp. J22P240 TaxID=3053514 RepID=UPI0025789EFD|nr:DUF3616 domain-containing protein [Variovorax sp. J22P240]MDM0002278.1 DUF3616 domain-containing protein [Variovorax sp. J22P240]